MPATRYGLESGLSLICPLDNTGQEQEELESYVLTDIVAAIGGYLGIFIGVSCLSFYDFLCQFVATIHATMKKNY